VATIAGHEYRFGRCIIGSESNPCSRLRHDVNSLAREAIRRGETLVDQEGVAHFGKCTNTEWSQIIDDIAAEDKAYEMAMGSL
jgi:hypothetical protein